MITAIPGEAASVVRFVFRLLFIIFFIYLGIVGTQCKKLATKLRLLRYGKIAVSHAAGWLQGTQVFGPLWHMRRIPDPVWWALMFFIALLAKVTDLSTVAITQAKGVSDFCDFTYGMVIDPSQGVFEQPPLYSKSYFQGANAQLTSLGNGCPIGIYWKADSDPNFCAADDDIMGEWRCSNSGPNVTYDYGSGTIEDICNDLVDKGLLDTGYTAFYDNSSVYDFTQLVAWSSDVSDTSAEVFDVKVSVDTTASYKDPKTMYSMYCELLLVPGNISVYADASAAALTNISSQIHSVTTLDKWTPMLQPNIYNGSFTAMVDDPEFWVEWTLNSMIMVAGSSDNIWRPAPDGLGAYDTQGCLQDLVRIPDGIISLMCLTFLTCVAMTTLLLYLWLRVRHFRDGRQQADHAPVDLWSWMAQAVAEADVKPDGTVDVVTPKELHRWNIQLTDTSMVRIEKRNGEPEHEGPQVVEEHQEQPKTG